MSKKFKYKDKISTYFRKGLYRYTPMVEHWENYKPRRNGHHTIYRHMKSYRIKKWENAWADLGYPARPKRINVTDQWDDIPTRLVRNWKRYRKTQYKIKK